MVCVRSYAPLTPVEEGLLADLTRSAAVDNNITEDTMNGLLVEWWSLVTTDVDSSAPELPRDERWKSVGFQSARPSSDFRTGPHALLCMVIAGRAYSPVGLGGGTRVGGYICYRSSERW